MKITDAQIHIWEQESPDHPWPPGGRERAHRPEPLTADEALRLMDDVGVERAVLVPPTFAGNQNAVCLRAAQSHPERFAVMGQIPTEEEPGLEALRRLRDQPGMLGIRITLSRGQAQLWLAEHRLDWLWQEAEDLGVPIYVLPPDLTDQLRTVAEKHPGLRLIIDHLSIRTGLQDDAIVPAVESVLRLADLPNVAVKATSLPTYVPSQQYPYPGLQALIQRVVTAFGPRRVFWGSDLSRLRGSYGELRSLFTEELDFVSSSDLEWIMGRGVSEWLGWG